ncbi:MAG TPA: hypothetical protein VFP47_10265, partial [Pyrinomonadaceae bacterium]|nr:hypothetical protein [Pyrinomonadaceae bacterium]
MASTTKPCGYTARANVECGYPKNDTEIWQDVAGVARRFCWRCSPILGSDVDYRVPTFWLWRIPDDSVCLRVGPRESRLSSP